MIRKATWDDLDAVERLYEEMHDAKAAGLIITNWKRGIYPSRATAEAALQRDDLFVMEEDGRIIGSGIINQTQLGIYAGAAWKHKVPDEQVCVLHTLMISEINTPARAMYRKHGFEEVGIATSELNGIPGVTLVMLEKHPDPKRELYLKQKHTLDLFLESGAISQAQYDKSLGDLTEKMGMNNAD